MWLEYSSVNLVDVKKRCLPPPRHKRQWSSSARFLFAGQPWKSYPLINVIFQLIKRIASFVAVGKSWSIKLYIFVVIKYRSNPKNVKFTNYKTELGIIGISYKIGHYMYSRKLRVIELNYKLEKVGFSYKIGLYSAESYLS